MSDTTTPPLVYQSSVIDTTAPQSNVIDTTAPSMTGISYTTGTITVNPTLRVGVIMGTKYSVMEIADDEMPESIYVNGKLMTLGIIGTKVQCAYMGNQIFFEHGIIDSWINSTISIVYEDQTCHYNLEICTESGVYKDANSLVLNTVLVSSVPRKGNGLG